MRARILVGLLLLFTLLSAGVVATSGDGVASTRQWAIVYLSEPTLIGDTIVQGPVMFTHDESKMARGEPCTTVALFEPLYGPSEEIASFHCIPTRRHLASKFVIRTQPDARIGFGCVLTEYQFAGDTEGHGVPTPRDAR
jgi:hypothetical protein